MNTVEKKLVAKLMEMAADEFDNHSCNDFDLIREGGLTKKEAKEVQKALFRDGVTEEEYKDGMAFDAELMGWLAKKLLAEASE